MPKQINARQAARIEKMLSINDGLVERFQQKRAALMVEVAAIDAQLEDLAEEKGLFTEQFTPLVESYLARNPR